MILIFDLDKKHVNVKIHACKHDSETDNDKTIFTISWTVTSTFNLSSQTYSKHGPMQPPPQTIMSLSFLFNFIFLPTFSCARKILRGHLEEVPGRIISNINNIWVVDIKKFTGIDGQIQTEWGMLSKYEIEGVVLEESLPNPLCQYLLSNKTLSVFIRNLCKKHCWLYKSNYIMSMC